MHIGGQAEIKDSGKLPRHRAHTAKSHRLQFILVLLFATFLGGTAYAGYEAYRTSYIELKLIGNKVFDFSETDGTFEEPGYIARYCIFSRCHDLTEQVIVESPHTEEIKNHTIGDYKVSYTLNYLGETHTDSREIIIRDIAPPELELNGEANIGLYIGQPFIDPGASASDLHDGDLSANITVEGEVNTSRLGVYTLVYKVKDAAGNATEKSRRVFVYNYSAFTSEPLATFDELRDYCLRNGWNLSFGFRNFEKDYTYTYDADRVYYGASLAKTLDAIYIYDRFGGPRNWNERYLLENAVSYSNNSAHVSLARSLGINNLKNYALEIGMQYHLSDGVSTFSDTTVNDQLAEWSKLWELAGTLSNGYELMNYFFNGVYPTMDFYGHPRIAYKAGFHGGTHHESAIIYADSPYFLTVLSMHGYWANREEIMRDISERVYLINQTL